jgi:capsular exopolysaccharide synthesis family protein
MIRTNYWLWRKSLSRQVHYAGHVSFAPLLTELLRRKAFLIVGAIVGAVVVAAVAGSFVLIRDPVYESRATVALLPDGDNPTLVPFYGQAVESLLPTYARLVESRTFQDSVAADLSSPISEEALAASVFADPIPDIGVLEMVGRSTSSAQAQALAQGVATQFVEELADNGIVTVRLIDPARVSTQPISPSPSVVLVVAVFVGALMGTAAALAWERTFKKVKTVHELTEASGLKVLGAFPEETSLRNARRVVVGDPGTVHLEESLRGLRTNLLFAVQRHQQGALLVTGLNPQDGKSTVAANLAVTVAELGFSVLLIDGDIHRPVQHEFFDLSTEVGLTSTILDDADPSSLAQNTKYEGLKVVTAGRPLETRAQEVTLYLKQLPRFASLAEIVLIDSPPLRAAEDVRLLAAFSGSVLLLVRAGTSSPAQVRQAIDSLEMLQTRVLGTVLTMAPKVTSPAGFEYYRYRNPQASDEDDLGSGGRSS